MEGADRDLTLRSSPFILEGVTLMVFLNQLRGEYISLVFPGVVSRGISLPFDEVLKISPLPEIAMIDDGLDFVFFFSINDVWGRAWKVVSVLTSFSERRQVPGVEDIMNGPGWRQFQLCCHIGDHASDAEWSVTFGRKFQ